MKKLIAIILALTCIVGLVGCSNNSMNHIIKTKPNVTGVVQEVHDDYVIIYSDSAQGYPNGSRWQISLNVENKDSYTTLTVGDEIVVYHNGQVMETEPLKVGKVFAITLKTPADRTQNEGDPTADEVSFHAKVLEVHDKYLLVEPLADSNESKSADKIEIPLKEKESWPIPAVDDLVKVVYDGNIMETYPARLGNVYRVEILTIIPTEDEPQPGGNVVDDWGLNVSAIDITPSGLKLVIVNSINNPTAFGYGSYYWLEQRIDNEWITVEFAPQEYDVAWTSELYMLKANDITTIGIDWEWLYGNLPDGHYRVGKNIDNFIQSQKGESRAYYAEFIIG